MPRAFCGFAGAFGATGGASEFRLSRAGKIYEFRLRAWGLLHKQSSKPPKINVITLNPKP